MFMRAYFRSAPAAPHLIELRRQNALWLATFRQLRSLSLEGESWQDAAAKLRQSILEQLLHEERQIFPTVEKFLLSNRPTREMLYEHEGIRRFLPGLEEALASRPGDRTWERFSLDLIHLLEHHIEHEERGLYPLYERLVEGGKGDGQVQ